jgi:alpha-L-fucosidase
MRLSRRVLITFLLSAATIFAALSASGQSQNLTARPSAPEIERDRRLKWFRDARFGLMIHWGLYSVPAGEWKGKLIPGLGEWIMNRARIPVSEYEQLAPQFNPVKFDADAWVRMARDAGMKYIVITSKHHDGFAMYGSKASKYNIVDATPFRRDVMKELAAATQRYGLKLCFYYSQTQDWHEADAVGNDWDFAPEVKKDFARYLEEKVKPQVTEILTNYGPIGLIWFDTPRNITKEQSQELVDLVHKLQPDCLVSGRVGHGLGDYDSAGDNQISVGQVKRDWETPVTMNDTWGFKRDDQNWKPTNILIQQLVQVSSRGGNYLLNVGPTSEGLIPQPSVERLAEVGQWLKINHEAVYGTAPSPFPYELPWGLLTTKPGRVFLHVFKWPQKPLVIYGLKSKVIRAYLLADKKGLKFTQQSNAGMDHYSLNLELPSSPPDKNDSVIVLEVNGKTEADTSLLQQPDFSVTLPAFLADIHKAGDDGLRLDTRGVVEKWVNKDEWLDWDFKVSHPGKFEVVLLSSEQKYGRDWEGGHAVEIEVAGQKLKGQVDNNGKQDNPANPYWKYVISKIGTVTIDKAGRYKLNLRPEAIRAEKKLGLTLVSVELRPVQN